MKRSLYFIFLVLGIFSCKDENRIIDQNEVIQNRVWDRDSVYEFSFNVQDTSKEYSIYLNTRNSLEYPYQNLFVLYTIEDDEGSLLSSFQKDVTLFDNFGKPLGDGNKVLGISFGDDYYSYHELTSYKFLKEGTYKVSVSQQMRDKKFLPGVLAVGIAVTK